MPALYLTEQNTILRKSGERLLFCHKPPGAASKPGVRQQDIILDLPCADVDHVMIYGNIQLTTQAMHQLLEHGIETALFSFHGELLGQITPPAGKNIELRLAQYERFMDKQFVLDFAKSLVISKIETALELVGNYARNHPDIAFAENLQSVTDTCANIPSAQTLDTLLGLEGAASAQYFQCLGKMLPSRWAFDGRSKRPPLDPPNAVLSFGYTIIASELQSLLDGAGFDPFLGYYHQPDYGRASLALDIVELFRHSLIDRLMLRLFNLNILAENDFMPVGKGAIYLSPSGKVKFFKQYEQLMGMYTSAVEAAAPKATFRALLQKQVYNLARSIKEIKPLEVVKFSVDL